MSETASTSEWSDAIPSELTSKSSSRFSLQPERSQIQESNPDIEIKNSDGILERNKISSSRFNWNIPEFIRSRITFYRLHFAYICGLTILGTFILYFSPKRNSSGSIPFIDALFNAASASCVVGLNSTDMQEFSISDQVVIMFLIICGGQVFTSLLPVLVRRFYFHQYIAKYTEQVENNPSLSRSPSTSKPTLEKISEHTSDVPRSMHERSLSVGQESQAEELNSLTWSGDTGKQFLERYKRAAEVWKLHNQHKEESERNRRESTEIDSENGDDAVIYTAEGRKVDPSKLRIKEYSALKMLSWLVPSYLAVVQLSAALLIRLNFAFSGSQRLVLKNANVNVTFFSIFQAVSSFQNAGLVLVSTSLAEFKTSAVLLITIGIVILLGNTMYAPTMRGVIYILSKMTRKKEKKETLEYLLNHPRKCYTHLFPSNVTKWLVFTVVAFNTIELGFFCLLDWTAKALEGLNGMHKLLIGLFQSMNTRSAGFLVINLAEIAPSMIVLYIIMMYVAVYPVFLSRQSSRENKEVYDELDIGIFNALPQDNNILSQSRNLIARDSVLVFSAMFLICIIQEHEIETDPNFAMVNILFEVVSCYLGWWKGPWWISSMHFPPFYCFSAYGNVGLSLGYTCVPESPGVECVSPTYSFVGAFKPLSKLIIILLMLVGRHRGLPENIDTAVTIPNPDLFRKGARKPIEEIDPLLLFLQADLSQHGSRSHGNKRSFGNSPAGSLASVLPKSKSLSDVKEGSRKTP